MITKRSLLNKAMPLFSLSNSQWEAVSRHLEKIESSDGADMELYNALRTLQANQAKIEIMDEYCDYYGRNLDDPVREEGISGLVIS